MQLRGVVTQSNKKKVCVPGSSPWPNVLLIFNLWREGVLAGLFGPDLACKKFWPSLGKLAFEKK